MSVTTEASSALSWLQRHERIVIVAMVLLAGTYFGQKYLNVKAAHDHDAAVVAVQQLNDQKKQDAVLAAQVTQLSGQYQQLQLQLNQENTQLLSAMQNRVTVLHQEQQAVKTMPLPDLGNRWAQLAEVAPTEITATTTGMTVSDTAARATVTQLERVPVLQANLKDSKTISDNKQQELDKANGLIDGLSLQVDGLNKTVTAEETACKAQITSVKADDAKAKTKWFKVGFGLGYVAGLATHWVASKL